MYYYKSKQVEKDKPVVDELIGLAELHPMYGCNKLYQLTHKTHGWNHKKVHRIYKRLKLGLRRKTRKRIVRGKQSLTLPTQPNQVWSMDFVSDKLYDKRQVRILNIIDDYNREALYQEIDTSIGSYKVTQVLELLINDIGKPKQIRVDNGSEFTAETFVKWCNKHRIEILYIQPGKPTQNAYIERFNGTYRREILNHYIFYSITRSSNTRFTFKM